MCTAGLFRSDGLLIGQEPSSPLDSSLTRFHSAWHGVAEPYGSQRLRGYTLLTRKYATRSAHLVNGG